MRLLYIRTRRTGAAQFCMSRPYFTTRTWYFPSHPHREFIILIFTMFLRDYLKKKITILRYRRRRSPLLFTALGPRIITIIRVAYPSYGVNGIPHPVFDAPYICDENNSTRLTAGTSGQKLF